MLRVEDIIDEVGYFSGQTVTFRGLAEGGVKVETAVIVGHADDNACTRFNVDVSELNQRGLTVAVNEVRLEVDDFVIVHL